jgi:hypothetical protein
LWAKARRVSLKMGSVIIRGKGRQSAYKPQLRLIVLPAVSIKKTEKPGQRWEGPPQAGCGLFSERILQFELVYESD